MNTKPEVTDEEILRSMNFDRVLNSVRQKELAKRQWIKRLKLALLGASVISIAGITYLYTGNPPKELSPNVSNHLLLQTTKDTTAQVEVPAKSPEKITSAKQLPAVTQKVSPVSSPAANIDETPITLSSDYKEAEPVAGFPALYEYFNKELKYPAAAVADSIQGVVTIQFVVSEKGDVGNVIILHSLGKECDAEAMRLIENMPHWKPAMLNQKPVASKITIPLTFSVQAKKRNQRP